MPPAGSETTIPAKQRLQTQALDCTATGIGTKILHLTQFMTPSLRQYMCVHLCFEQ